MYVLRKVREDETQSSWVPHLDKQEDNYNRRGSLQGAKGLSPKSDFLAWGSALCRWAQRMFGFKDSRAYFWGNQMTERNRESTLNGCTQNLTCSRTRAEAVIWKEPGSDSPADLKSPLERQQATVVHPGYTDTGTAILGSLYYQVDTGAEKHHFESFL